MKSRCLLLLRLLDRMRPDGPPPRSAAWEGSLHDLLYYVPLFPSSLLAVTALYV
jgi:hypothetical protein